MQYILHAYTQCTLCSHAQYNVIYSYMYKYIVQYTVYAALPLFTVHYAK